MQAMTEREAFKVVQGLVLALCNEQVQFHGTHNDPDSNLLQRAWTAQRNSCVVHLQGVKGIQSLPPSQSQPEAAVDPYADDNDPPAVRSAKEKLKAVMGNANERDSYDQSLSRFLGE